MSILRIISIVTITTTSSLAYATNAHAICEIIHLGDGDEDVIVGEEASSLCWQTPTPGCAISGLGHIGICVIEDGIETYIDVPDCNTGTAIGNQIEIYTHDGDDRLATMPPIDGGFACDGRLIHEIDPYRFRFGIAAHMGEGSDMFAGSEHIDWATSNDWVGGQAAADSSFDLLCGWGGDDTLLGDKDNSTGILEEVMYGGAGADHCDGDWGVNGNNSADAYYDCSAPADRDARLSVSAFNLCWEQGGASGWGYF